MAGESKILKTSLERAVALLDARFHPAAILVHGSVSKGTARASSDVDLAILMGARAADPFAIAAAKTDLEEIVGAAVDLAVLDDASPILRMEVLRNGQILLKRDPERFEDFVVRTLGDYFDLKKVREPIEKALLASASE